MKNKKLLILVLLLSLFSFKVSAADFCSINGFTLVNINGIFTSDQEAILNKEKLKQNLPKIYKSEPIIVDYLYNSTHLAGAGDIVDVVNQGLFNSKSDFDLVEMLNDASSRIKTQKLLVVGYSQGNFYANNFYDKVADMAGGIPKASIGVYGVATPADHVAGDGKYLTSDTDKVISTLVSSVKNIMTPNTHIELQDKNNNGHSFSDVYLKYRGSQIVSDIKSSLDKLSSNQIQNTQDVCISPQKISLGHKINGAVIGAADFVVDNIIKVGSFAYDKIAVTMKSLAYFFGNNSNKNLAAAGSFDGANLPATESQVLSEPALVETTSNLETQQDLTVDPAIENINPNSSALPYEQSNNPESINTYENIYVAPNNNESENIITNNNTGGGGSSYSSPVISIDKKAPVITINGESNINIKVGSTYNDLGAVAVDNIDGTVPAVTTGSVDTGTIGSYVITYTSTDKALNVSTLTRTVNVVKNETIDTTPPTITLVGENTLSLELGANYTDLGATAIDDVDGNIVVVVTGAVDTGIVGSYILTYTATDKALNTSTLTRTVNVVKGKIVLPPNIDSIAPVITLNGESILNIELGSIYTEPGATAIDTIDGVVSIITSGIVDTSNIGKYTIKYTAIDTAKNTATLNRTVSVVNTSPVISKVATLSFPNSGDYAADGLDQNRGRSNLTAFNFHAIYTDANNNAPEGIKLHVKNTSTGILLPEISMSKISTGTDALSDGNYANGELFTISSTYDVGTYSYSFAASDRNKNTTNIAESSLLRFSVIASTYKYLPKYTFGPDNGDGNDWQVWSFNGSNVYDWSDTYVNNYLREQFKIQTYPGGYWSALCLQRGIFNHDPQKGFETSDVFLSCLENNPQNSMNGKTYNATIQWDSTGYTYTISYNSVIESTGHTDVINMNNDLWVGWDDNANNFKTFPSGHYDGVPYASPMQRTGGSYMTLQPFPVYDSSSDVVPTPDPIPTPVLSSEKLITSFNFDSLVPGVNGVVNNGDHTVNIIVSYGTSVTSIAPTIIVSEKAKVAPSSGTAQDFTNPVVYTVKAEDNSVLTYTAVVSISPNPNIDPNLDTTPPNISSYSLNGNQSNINIDPIVNNVSIVLNANKNVNWMSIKIEKEDDPSIYRMFMSGAGCVDGTNSCTKVWDGLLSKGGLLQNGNYKIKIHLQDAMKNDYDEYLPSLIIVNNQ